MTPSPIVAGRTRWLPWPKRLDVALLAFFALVIAYCDRVNISVAAPSMMREYGWDTAGMGWVLSGFFAGYALMMIPAGMLADRFGPKRVFAVAMTWWSVLTAFTPLPRSLGALTAMRVFMGAGESGTFPSMNGILVRWFPRQEYSRVTGFCWSGGYAGSIVGVPLGSLILAMLGWRAVFWIFAAIGMIWVPLWYRTVADQPEQSPAVTDAELAYIRAARPEIRKAERAPWGRILSLPAFWGLFALHFSSNWFAYVMISCCHNHPWEKYTQDDFYGFAAFFARLDTKFVHAGSESDVYLKDSGEVIHPKTRQAVQLKYLDGPTDTEQPGQDIRQALARWITSPKNPFFARTISNRIWRRYFDRGIVEPVDDFRVTNPPSDADLLNALAADFVAHGFSIKHLERTILNSRAYQLSSLPNDSNRRDTVNFSRYYLKRMSAEELMDAIVQITGVEERFTGWAPGTRAMQIPHGAPSFLLTAFGRVADREFAQDRKEDPSITQVLHLMNGTTLNEKIVSPQGRLAKWLAAPGMDNAALTDGLFLTALARHARPEEQAAVSERIAAGPPDGRGQVFQDVLWALVKSKEFIYNH